MPDDRNLTSISVEELEKAYNSAARGKGIPSLIIFNCPICRITYFLPQDKDIICEHWMRKETK